MFLTLFAKESGIAGAGLFFTISVVFMLAARIISGKISDRYGVLKALLPVFSTGSAAVWQRRRSMPRQFGIHRKIE